MLVGATSDLLHATTAALSALTHRVLASALSRFPAAHGLAVGVAEALVLELNAATATRLKVCRRCWNAAARLCTPALQAGDLCVHATGVMPCTWREVGWVQQRDGFVQWESTQMAVGWVQQRDGFVQWESTQMAVGWVQ